MESRTKLPVSVLILLLVIFSLEQGVAGGGKLEALQKEDLAVGYIRGQFYRVNRLDAEAAFKTLARTLGVKHGYDVKVTVTSFEGGEEIEAYLRHSTLHLIIYDSLDYLKSRKHAELEPLFVSVEDGNVMHRYVLLSGKAELNSLETLRKKTLNVYSGPNNSLAGRWLNVLLQNRFGLDINSFFSSVKTHTEPLAAILPVFFGKQDAVLVDFSKYELMAELNPQLRKLVPVVISEPYISDVICFYRSGWTSEKFRQDMLRAMSRLHETAAGRQILMLFRAEKIAPFDPFYLESAQRLEQNILNMKKHSAEPYANEKQADG